MCGLLNKLANGEEASDLTEKKGGGSSVPVSVAIQFPASRQSHGLHASVPAQTHRTSVCFGR